MIRPILSQMFPSELVYDSEDVNVTIAHALWPRQIVTSNYKSLEDITRAFLPRGRSRRRYIVRDPLALPHRKNIPRPSKSFCASKSPKFGSSACLASPYAHTSKTCSTGFGSGFSAASRQHHPPQSAHVCLAMQSWAFSKTSYSLVKVVSTTVNAIALERTMQPFA